MLYRVIDASEMPALIDAFMQSYEVVAPIKRGDSGTSSTSSMILMRWPWIIPRPARLRKSTCFRQRKR